MMSLIALTLAGPWSLHQAALCKMRGLGLGVQYESRGIWEVAANVSN